MQRSNLYIVVFSTILTIVLGGLLALAAEGLKSKQQVEIKKDTRKHILSAVMELTGKEDVMSLFDQRIQMVVVNSKGEPLEADADGNALIAEKVNIGKEYKKPSEDRLLPVFKFMSESNPDQVEAYIVSVYGNGLWDKIWGFVALGTDLNTIIGISFDHKAETPGLGARITDKEIRDRYVGKQIFDTNKNLVSVEMMKGELRNPSAFDQHHVDGLSGATLTSKGVNAMLQNYLNYYQAFFEKVASGSELASAK